MTEAAELVVTVSGKDTASSVLANLEAQLDKTSTSADRAGTQIGAGLGASQDRARAGSLSLAQAQARLEVQQANLARAQGDGARAAELMASAEQRLTAALSQETATTTQTINAQRQLASIQTQVAREAQGATAATGGLGASLSSLAPLAGAAGAAFAAIGTVQKVAEFATLGESVNRTGTSFARLATQAGTTGQALLTALRSASGGEISDLNLQLAANRAQLLGVASSAQQFGVLMSIAKQRAADMGITTTQAFNDLVTGLGRGSALILDNLGITVNATEANKAYAAEIGKTAAQLTDAERKQALINAVIAQGQASMAGATGAVDEYAGAWARAGAGFENLKNQLATMAAEGLAPAATGFARLTEGTSGLEQIFLSWGASAEFARTQAELLTGATDQGSRSAGDWTVAAGAQATAAQADAAAITELAATIQESADKSVVDTANKAAQTAQTQLLEAQTNAAVTAFLSLNPTIDAAGIAALVTAGKISPLIGQLAAAAQEANIATAALAAFANAQSEAAFAKGAAAQITPHLVDTSGIANAAGKAFGGGLKTAFQKEFPAVIRRGGGGGGGGGGGAAAALSDQQKLNTSLIADQEAYQTRVEDAEKAHQQKILDIQAQYNERAKAAERAFEQDQLDGRAGFYDALGQIKDPKLAQQLSAQYEDAARQAGVVAQQQGADVAQKYLDARTAALQAQAKRAADIQAALEAGDKGKAEYLKGVDALYKNAEQKKIDAILAGQGSIAAERDKALADEAAKYADTQDKNALAADRAADRKIAAAERAGKKIDEEQIKIDTLTASYDRIAPTATPGQQTTAIAPVAATTTAAAPAATQDAIVAALASAKDAIVAALASVESATNRGAARVASAVASSGGAVR